MTLARQPRPGAPGRSPLPGVQRPARGPARRRVRRLVPRARRREHTGTRLPVQRELPPRVRGDRPHLRHDRDPPGRLRGGPGPGHAAREPRRRPGDQRGRLALVVRPHPVDVAGRERDRRPGAGARQRPGLTGAVHFRREDPMSVRTTPPFRADHVGSLLRPRALLQAREDAARGAISANDLRAIEDDAIRDAVGMQEDLGLCSVTDGEFRRASWHMDFIYEIAGVQKADQAMKSVFHNEDGDIEFTPTAVRITSKIGMDHTIFGSAFEFLRDTATSATPKLTPPAPTLVHYRGGPAAIDHDVYPDIDAFWDDLGAAYADEVRRL